MTDAHEPLPELDLKEAEIQGMLMTLYSGDIPDSLKLLLTKQNIDEFISKSFAKNEVAKGIRKSIEVVQEQHNNYKKAIAQRLKEDLEEIRNLYPILEESKAFHRIEQTIKELEGEQK